MLVMLKVPISDIIKMKSNSEPATHVHDLKRPAGGLKLQGESNNTLLSIFWCTFCASMWSHCADGDSAQLLVPLTCPVDTLPAARARRRSAWPSRRRARPQPPSGQPPAAAQRHTSSVYFTHSTFTWACCNLSGAPDLCTS